MINDTHLHTAFSPDSSTPPEEVIKRAVSLRMSDICITDHYDYDVTYGNWAFDPDEYFEVLTPLKEKYKDDINVHYKWVMSYFVLLFNCSFACHYKDSYKESYFLFHYFPIYPYKLFKSCCNILHYLFLCGRIRQ